MFLIPDSYIKVQRTKNKGNGVFAAHEIKPGTIIGDYVGTVMNDTTIDAMPEEFHKELYFASIGETIGVIPDKNKVGIHLINHSCEPNLAFTPYKNRTFFVSMRRIFVGEELTINYLIDAEMGEKNYYICHCNAPTCKGTWYNHPHKIEQFDKDTARKNATEKVTEPVKEGTVLTRLPQYPDNFADDPFYDLFGSLKKPPLIVQEKALVPIDQLRQLIRESGRYLFFAKLHLIVRGICDNQIITTYKEGVKS